MTRFHIRNNYMKSVYVCMCVYLLIWLHILFAFLEHYISKTFHLLWIPCPGFVLLLLEQLPKNISFCHSLFFGWLLFWIYGQKVQKQTNKQSTIFIWLIIAWFDKTLTIQLALMGQRHCSALVFVFVSVLELWLSNI